MAIKESELASSERTAAALLEKLDQAELSSQFSQDLNRKQAYSLSEQISRVSELTRTLALVVSVPFWCFAFSSSFFFY